MSGIAARLTKILLLAGLTLALLSSSAAAAGRTRTPMLGVVQQSAHLIPAPHLLSMAAQAASPTPLTFDSRYESVINQFFTDVAHDSGGTQNIYSVATQYSDLGSVPIQYASTFGGSYVDHDPLPANGCDDGSDTSCLTDKQLQTEIQSVLNAKGWHGGLNHLFFLLTPSGVGSCFSAVGECSDDSFCAYHSAFTDSNGEDVIYANEPYEGPGPGCTDSSQGFPNDSDADTTVNTISHEQNEAITDPLGTGWFANDASEDEEADLCAYGFGTQTGTPGVDAYNQVINGHHYDLQEEYSNAADGGLGGCVQHLGGPTAAPPADAKDGSGPLVYHNGPVMHTNTTYAIYWLPTARNTKAPVVTGKPVVDDTLETSAGSWGDGGTPSSYQWQRCSSTGMSCVDISGATATTYKLTLADAGHVVRSTVRATNVNGVSPPAGSKHTARVVDIPAAGKAPRISGKTRVGQKLLGSHGSWTYFPSYRYQWLRCNAHGASCSSIRHATHPTYKLTSRDAGHRLRLRVTATNAAGRVVAVSPASPRIKH